MAKTFKKEFIANGLVARVIKRQSGKNSFLYEIRYRRNGYNISASSTDLKEAKAKFLKMTQQGEIEKYCVRKDDYTSHYDTFNFAQFAHYYFEKFRKPKVAEKTYYGDYNRLKRHILPKFGDMAIKDITPSLCQNLIDSLTAAQKYKTADEIYSLLSILFKGAIAHNIITRNPLDIVLHIQHDREHGKALTTKEQNAFLEAIRGSTMELPFIVALYTGLRPNELETAKIDGAFIVAKNSKRKNKKIEYKRIYICNKLAAYLKDFQQLPAYNLQYLSRKFPQYCPGHKLYDLRTTFNTKCEELGLAEAARKHFMGHSFGTLGNAYTDLSDEYLIKEGEKLNNW